MRRLLLAVAPLLAVLVSGCGGTTHYTAAKTTACLKEKKFKIFPQHVSAARAKELKLETLLGLNSPGHLLVFYENEKAAKQAQRDFLKSAANAGAAGSDTVEQQKNVVLVLPSEDRTLDQTILDCLK